MRVITIRPLLLTCLCLCTGCGLLFSDELEFREYRLRDVGYDDAVEIVRSVTQQFYVERFTELGGFTLDWDAPTGNLKASPVNSGDRRMTFYLSLEAHSWGTAVNMLALVEHLDQGGIGVVAWGNAQQDVFFEQALYSEFLEEIVRRREG
jgi:hypothetical protein